MHADVDSREANAALSQTVLDTSPPVIVAGMHRSGTSLVSGLLQSAGVAMGEAQESNRESVFFLEMNRRILEGLGFGWRDIGPLFPSVGELHVHFDRRVGRMREMVVEGLVGEHMAPDDAHAVVDGGRRWGWKDPRNSLLLPLWARALPGATLVHVYRDGRDVALSLMRRDAQEQGWDPITDADDRRVDRFIADVRTWEGYERRIRESRVFFDTCVEVRYEDLLGDPERRVSELLDEVGVTPVTPIRALVADIDADRSGRVEGGDADWAHELDVDSDLLEELGYVD